MSVTLVKQSSAIYRQSQNFMGSWMRCFCHSLFIRLFVYQSGGGETGMRQRNCGNIQGEQTMKEVFARISLQLTDFQRILQEMRSSRRRGVTSPDRDAKSEWLFAAGDA
jgi:hypothetical protein